MKLLDLFIVAFIPVLKVLLLTALGLFLALDRVDILGKEARKHLNYVAFFVFNPALVASSLEKYITLKSISLLWFMPFNVLLTFIIGSALGWILLKITKAPSDLWGLVLGCCAAGNLGNLPLIIIPTVCKERGSPFGDVHTCYNQGMAYSALSMAIGAIYMWSYVYNIMRICSNKRSEGAKPDDFTESRKPAVETAENLSNSHLGSLLPLKSSSPREDHLDHLELDQANTSEGKPKFFFFLVAGATSREDKQFFQTFAMKTNLRKLFAPSTIGAVVGFLVGSIPQVRKVLIGDSAPLRVVEDSASLLGDAAIPTVTIIMGANLLKGLKGSKIHLTLMIGILVIRYIALPIVGVVIVKLAIHLGLVKSNPLYQFVLLLQFALPPAVNIGTMSQLFGVGESECSVIMLWFYSLASVSLTVWTTFFMWFVK